MGGNNMEDGNCSRSLGPTLLAAASTFGLFAAANWGMWLLIGNPFWKLICDPKWARTSRVRLFLAHLMFAFAMPLYPFFIVLTNVLRVTAMKASLSQNDQTDHIPLDHDIVATMTTCPIFIEIPPHETSDLEGYRIVKDFEGFILPLKLSPAASWQAQNSAACHKNQVNSTESGAGGGSGIQPQSAENRPTASPALREKLYILLSKPRDKEQQAREVLLKLRLVPQKEELQLLRSRSLFVTVVTMLQAVGYTLGVVERLVARVAISPLEAILTFLCLLVALQLLVELLSHVSGNYHRPLLLSLSEQEFSTFRAKPRCECKSTRLRLGKVTISEVHESILGLLISLVMAAPFLYTALSFLHHSQYLSSLSAFLFFCVPPTTILGSIVFRHVSLDKSVQKNVAIHCECLLFFLSFAFALVATVRHWDLFQKSSRNIFFQWVLPHVAA